MSWISGLNWLAGACLLANVVHRLLRGGHLFTLSPSSWSGRLAIAAALATLVMLVGIELGTVRPPVARPVLAVCVIASNLAAIRSTTLLARPTARRGEA